MGRGRRLTGWTEAEFETLFLIADTADATMPRCPGPLVIHRSGDFECHGPCGSGPDVDSAGEEAPASLFAWYHDDDAPAPCSRNLVRQLEVLRVRCVRCR